jgi:hypothetical protein
MDRDPSASSKPRPPENPSLQHGHEKKNNAFEMPVELSSYPLGIRETIELSAMKQTQALSMTEHLSD